MTSDEEDVETKMKAVYRCTGRQAEWDGLLATRRAENARTPRLLAELDRLTGPRSPILDA